MGPLVSRRATRSPTSRTSAARRRSTSSPRTVAARPSSSPAARARHALRSGVVAGRRAHGLQRQGRRAVGRRGRRGEGARSPTTARGRWATTPGLPTEATSLSACRNERIRLAAHLERGRRQDAADDRGNVQRVQPGLGPRGRLPVLLSERPRLRAADLDSSSGTSPAIAGPASSPWPCATTSSPFPPESDEVSQEEDGEDDDGTRATEKDDDENEEEATSRQDRLRRPGPARGPGAGGGRQLRRLVGNKGNLLYVRTGPFFYGRFPGASLSCASSPSRSARSGRWSPAHAVSRSPRTAEGPGAAERASSSTTSRKGGGEQGRLHGGSRGGPRPGRVGADLRRGVAPLPRLLLRGQHARLRLGGPARPVPGAGSSTSLTDRT